MTYLSMLEKFKILFNMLLDTKLLLIFIGILFILTLIYSIKKISGKKYIILVLISLFVIFTISIIDNYKILSSTFDDFITILFSNIYFPSIYVYIGIVLIISITFIISMLNKKQKKVYKVINSIVFIINNILLVIILNIIAKNKIDIFSISSLYTNKSLLAILEISMGVFILWVIAHIISYTTNCICDNKNIEVTTDNNVYIKNNSRLAKENKKLFKNNKKIINENNKLLESNNILEEKNKILFEDNNRIINENNKLLESNNILEEKNKILFEDNNKIISENNKLLESNNILEEKNKILFEDNNRIINENNKLLENNTILEEKNKILFEDNNRITNDNNILIKEKNKIEEEYSILLEEKITSVKEEKVSNYNYTSNITLNDILGGILPVTYYADDVNNSYVYNLIDPQKLYEKNYNIALEETQKEISVNDVIEEVTSLTNNIELKELVTDNIITVEDITKQEKERISNERLAINTISLNDLVEGEFVSEISNLEDEIVDEKEEVSFVEISEESNVIKEELTIKDSYTIKDYKRIIEMLNTLKNHSDSSNISIDDAVSISLISNYSIDDCIKFKEILESNLN